MGICGTGGGHSCMCFLIMLATEQMGIKKILYIFMLILPLVAFLLLLLFHRKFPYIIVKNFLLVGLPYFYLGTMLRGFKGDIKARVLILLALLFSFTTFLERYFLVRVGLNATRDHYISTTFQPVTVFLLCKEIYQNHRLTGIEEMATKVGRSYSTWVYIMHPIIYYDTYSYNV